NSSADTYVWDGSNWTKKSTSAAPPGRTGHVMAFDSTRGQAVLFGGGFNTNLNDTWTWDGSAWTKQNPQTSPPARQFAAAAYDPVHDQVVLFSGQGSANLNDTWTWTGAAQASNGPNITLVANAFGDTPLVAPNTWVEIKGTKLAPAGDSRIWKDPDFVNN